MFRFIKIVFVVAMTFFDYSVLNANKLKFHWNVFQWIIKSVDQDQK